MIWTESVAGPPKRLFRLKKGDLWSISEILAKNDKLWFYLRNYFQWEVWFIFKIKLRCLKGEQRLFCRISSAYKWKLYHVSINNHLKSSAHFLLVYSTTPSWNLNDYLLMSIKYFVGFPPLTNGSYITWALMNHLKNSKQFSRCIHQLRNEIWMIIYWWA